VRWKWSPIRLVAALWPKHQGVFGADMHYWLDERRQALLGFAYADVNLEQVGSVWMRP